MMENMEITESPQTEVNNISNVPCFNCRYWIPDPQKRIIGECTNPEYKAQLGTDRIMTNGDYVSGFGEPRLNDNIY